MTTAELRALRIGQLVWRREGASEELFEVIGYAGTGYPKGQSRHNGYVQEMCGAELYTLTKEQTTKEQLMSEKMKTKAWDVIVLMKDDEGNTKEVVQVGIVLAKHEAQARDRGLLKAAADAKLTSADEFEVVVRLVG